MKAKTFLRAMGAAVGIVAGLAALGTAQAAEKYKIYLSMSYIGNDWQAEAANMVKAMAGSKLMRVPNVFAERRRNAIISNV